MPVVPDRVLASVARPAACLAGALAMFAGIAATSACAEPVGRPVRCGNIDCGQMVIGVYERFEDGDALPTFERKGVSIRGRFRPGADRTTNFRFLQAFTQYRQDDVRWIRDPAVPLPPAHLDPPPFGQRLSALDRRNKFVRMDRVFDAMPWYDDVGEFPLYEDFPRAFLADARKYGAVRMHFETWLVCVIEDRQGADANRVSDDRYEVAALVGWRWGYDIVHHDVGRVGVDEMADYTFTVRSLTFIDAPTDEFRAALVAPYGGDVQDGFDITLGDCQRCFGSSR
jgi:hypothetical protein